MGYYNMTVVELGKSALARGIDIKGFRKSEIVDALENADAAEEVVVSEGDVLDIDTEERPEVNVTEPVGNVTEPEENLTEPEENVPVLKRVLFCSRNLMRGDDVAAVHKALAAHNNKALAANMYKFDKDAQRGVYGAETVVAVKFFQMQKRLIVDGRVGKFTAQALGLVWEG